MPHQTGRQFADEDDRRYYEEMRAKSDEELLAEMKQLRDGLIADDHRLALELGLPDEYVEKISGDIAKLEKAMTEDRLANERLNEAARKLNAAADRYVAAFDPEYPDILDDGDEKRC